VEKKLKKIRLNYGFLRREFKHIIDISVFLKGEEFNSNPEAGLIKIMDYLNNI
jgi:hypothetical protein